MTDSEANKLTHLQWIARLYSHDPAALPDEVAEAHLFNRLVDFGGTTMSEFLEGYKALNKLRETHGDFDFELGDIEHVADDLTVVDFNYQGRTIFELRVRFATQAPNRIRYWMSYPPLPDTVRLRAYTPADAPGCVELERACPMEMSDGSSWVIDRGEAFDDYLRLMGQKDAMVAVEVSGEQERVIGFYSNTLRPMRMNEVDCFSVYQHHYRVHPDYRAGSVSLALASWVDARRTFDGLPVVFPYSMVDPNNAHMQNVGFPAADGVRIARLSIPVAKGERDSQLSKPDLQSLVDCLNQTHATRAMFKPYDTESLAARCEIAEKYSLESFRRFQSAVIGVWAVNERNILNGDEHSARRLAFALDYGFSELEDLQQLILGVCAELDESTHLAFLCDTRSPEYDLLKSMSDDEQSFAVHTLPWTTNEFQKGTVYCDAVYC